MANIAIDLGTTHSLVAGVLGGPARCLLDDDERALLPSVLRYDASGELTALGYDALSSADSAEGHTFSSRTCSRAPGVTVGTTAKLQHGVVTEDGDQCRHVPHMNTA